MSGDPYSDDIKYRAIVLTQQIYRFYKEFGPHFRLRQFGDIHFVHTRGNSPYLNGAYLYVLHKDVDEYQIRGLAKFAKESKISFSWIGSDQGPKSLDQILPQYKIIKKSDGLGYLKIINPMDEEVPVNLLTVQAKERLERDIFVEAFNQSYGLREEEGKSICKGTIFSRSEEAKKINKIFLSPDGSQIVIGISSLVIFNESPKLGYVQYLGVMPQYQNMGFAQSILKEIINDGIQLRLEGLVASSYGPPKGLFSKSFGFKEINELRLFQFIT